MTLRSTELSVVGTSERVPEAMQIELGPLTARIDDGALRDLSWDGIEVVRSISCPIRDESWQTCTPGDVSDAFEADSERARFERQFTVMDGDLACRVTYRAESGGRVEASVELSARRTIRTNRAGFTLLHPIRGVAGSPAVVGHSDGSREETSFPRLVSPAQPVFDIRTLEHRVGHVFVKISFDGEVFEMEDQRNWTDASYKTYCRPLARPFPFEIAAGETVLQSITVELRDAGEPAVLGTPPDTSATVSGTAPDILIALDEGWWPGAAAATAIDEGAWRYLIRIPEYSGELPAWVIEAAGSVVRDGEIDLEIVVPDSASPADYLREVRAALDAAGIRPRRIMALPKAYLKSYQPDALWPTGNSPTDVAEASRRAFPGAEIGVGMLTNFTELNRCRPSAGLGDYVTHGTTAIVHAADDLSVVQTLEALPDIYASTRVFSDAPGYRLGLCSIGMRDNPYGEAVAPNPNDQRIAMARNDPRHKALFGAAFAAGVAAAAARSGVQAFAPAGLAGPFGLGSFEDGRFQPLPIFHVVRALARLQSLPLVSTPPLPEGVHGLAAKGERGTIAVLANCGFEPATVTLAESMSIQLLDQASAAGAATRTDWLDMGDDTVTSAVQLDPFTAAICNPAGPAEPRVDERAD